MELAAKQRLFLRKEGKVDTKKCKEPVASRFSLASLEEETQRKKQIRKEKKE